MQRPMHSTIFGFSKMEEEDTVHIMQRSVSGNRKKEERTPYAYSDLCIEQFFLKLN